jgi:hypothetical protein
MPATYLRHSIFVCELWPEELDADVGYPKDIDRPDAPPFPFSLQCWDIVFFECCYELIRVRSWA